MYWSCFQDRNEFFKIWKWDQKRYGSQWLLEHRERKKIPFLGVAHINEDVKVLKKKKKNYLTD